MAIIKIILGQGCRPALPDLVGLSSLGGIHPFPKFLSKLEVDNRTLGYLNWLPGLGVAPDPWLAMVQRKPAEPANFDALAILQRKAQPVKYRPHGGFYLFGWKMVEMTCQQVCQF